MVSCEGNVFTGGVPFFSITIDGFEKYAKAYIPEYKAIVRDVHLQIVNEGKSDKAFLLVWLGDNMDTRLP